MLHELLANERSTILHNCEERIIRFGGPLSGNVPVHGWSVFYSELIDTLLGEDPGRFVAESRPSVELARKQVREYVTLGYSVRDVMESFGILSDSIRDAAQQGKYQVDSHEYFALSQVLRSATAEAVAEYERITLVAKEEREIERLGTLAHELRNGIQSAMASFDMIESGVVGANSSTSNSLQHSLQRIAGLIDRALTEVRMRVEPEVNLIGLNLSEILNDVASTASYQARTRSVSLRMEGFASVHVLGDRHLVVSALSNLVQNAVKYTRHGSTVRLIIRQDGPSTFVDVQDECGGLPESMQVLLKPFTYHSSDHSGLGLGLTIVRQALHHCNGKLLVQDMPGVGCIFTMQLPTYEGQQEPQWP